MPAQVLTDLEAATTAAKGAMESATVLIGGIAQRVQDAVNAAIAGGATAADLAPVQQVVTDLNTDATALSTAVVANSPAVVVPPVVVPPVVPPVVP